MIALCSAPSMRSAYKSECSARAFRAAFGHGPRLRAARERQLRDRRGLARGQTCRGQMRLLRRAQAASRPPQAPARAGATRRVWTRASTARNCRAAGRDVRCVARILRCDP
jgi:hypothetical protein